jgi:acetyl-CoA C-acetyltransferase
MTADVFVIAARRTPIGAFQGALSAMAAPELGSIAARAALHDAGIAASSIDEAIFGCVLTAGMGQAPARQAALGADLASSVPATTINKMCGSGMKAVMLACEQIRAGSASVMLAGGFESMSNAPYLLSKARQGYRMGHGQVIDHMMWDGLQNAYGERESMGIFAENTALKFGFSRSAQDAFAAESVRRAIAAVKDGRFNAEITPVTVKGRKAEQVVDTDETPFTCDVSKIAQLKPAFRADGTVTAASSSSISDGAAALVLADSRTVERLNLRPLARVVSYTSYAQDPQWFTTAPVGAIAQLLRKIDWAVDKVDLFEVNEAFACVTLAAMHELGINHAQVNVHGGACALGHPIGATGARILTTLVHAMRGRKAQRGIAALCIGGGEATAMAVELCD